MKFKQRVIMLSSATGLTILYLLLCHTRGVEQVWNVNHARHHRSLFAEYEFEQDAWNTAVKSFSCEDANSKASLLFDDAEYDNGTISTFDLPSKTNYMTYSNKQYGLSHPQADDTREDTLNVIIMPHSHVDAGWLQTIEDYYVENVKKILNNMIKKLKKYEDMTFVWAESVFLSMWWNELEDDMKLHVRRLVQKGQLEIVSGGWVMSDEASTYYASVIDQLTEGHQWIFENLHVKPENSWAIDPFGYSGTMPYLWKEAGMKNMVIQRVHQAIKATLAQQTSLEFNWRQYWDRSGSTDILCHVMPYVFYGMQYTCGPDKQICAMYDYGKSRALNQNSTGKVVTDDNIKVQAKYLYDQYRLKSRLYRYNSILVPIGDDFRFDTASEWDQHYENYVKLMNYMNNQKDWNIKVRFGTLKQYFDLVRRKESQNTKNSVAKMFPVLKGDFFPYSDQNSDYWTGFYSTRPFDKQLSRDVESNLRAADVLNVLAHAHCKRWGVEYGSYHEVAAQLQEARRNLGVFLHHDAITGTAKPHVVLDYEDKLLEAYNMTQSVIRSTVQTLLSRGQLDQPNILRLHHVRVDSITPPLKSKIHVGSDGTRIILINPVAQVRVEFVKIIVDDCSIEIQNSDNVHIPIQINPVFKSSMKMYQSKFEVVFLAELQPFGITTYTVRRVESTINRHLASVQTFGSHRLNISNKQAFHYVHTNEMHSAIDIENEFTKATFNRKGMLMNVFDKTTKTPSSVSMDFMAYKTQGSGAYIFYPSGKARSILHEQPVICVIKGPFMEQVLVKYDHLTHTATFYDAPTTQGQGLHIQNTLDMNIYDMRDMEVIMRVTSDVKNEKGSFYTDQNGFQLIGRQNNKNRRIETNYYPITSMAVLEDHSRRLTLHSRQSHGVASLDQGWLEVMLDRQVMSDDYRGLGEGVWDNKPTVSDFVLHIEYKLSSIPVSNFRYTFPSLSSVILNDFLQQPIQTVSMELHNALMQTDFKPVNQSLPCDISVLSLKNLVNSDLIYKGSSVVLHRRNYACNFPVVGLQCSVNYGKVTLHSLFPNIPILQARETTLTHLHSIEDQPVDKNIEIQPMKIKSIHMTI